jgi:hypothetical protein
MEVRSLITSHTVISRSRSFRHQAKVGYSFTREVACDLRPRDVQELTRLPATSPSPVDVEAILSQTIRVCVLADRMACWVHVHGSDLGADT